jgi:hypothetical protein
VKLGREQIKAYIKGALLSHYNKSSAMIGKDKGVRPLAKTTFAMAAKEGFLLHLMKHYSARQGERKTKPSKKAQAVCRRLYDTVEGECDLYKQNLNARGLLLPPEPTYPKAEAEATPETEDDMYPLMIYIEECRPSQSPGKRPVQGYSSPQGESSKPKRTRLMSQA